MASAASAMSFSSTVSNSRALLPKEARRSTVQSTASGSARLPIVAVAVVAENLETRSTAELRSLARQRGLRGDTRAELLELLSAGHGGSSNGAASSNGASSAGSGGGVRGLDERTLRAMPLAQLRAVARTKGVQGLTTRDQIIQALLGSSSAVPSPPPPAQSYAPAPASSSTESSAPLSGTSSPALATGRQQLQSKSLPVLRALARSRGIPNWNASNKEQLILLLLQGTTPASSPSISTSPAQGSSAPSASTDLASLSLSQLRQLGKQYGVRGDTRTELISLLSGTAQAPVSSPAFATAPAAATATAFADPVPETLPLDSAATTLPPFQSETPEGGVALERVKLATEVSALKKAVEEMEQRDKALEAEKDSLVEQANFLRNVLVGGIGLAVLPLVLPFQTAVTTSTTASLETAPAATASAGLEAVSPPAPPPPVVREVSPEDYCAAMPSDLLSPQVAKFCEALIEPTY